MIYHNLIKPAESLPAEASAQTERGASSNNTPTVIEQGGDKKDKVVVMQGPLSTIYTDALNQVYAQESQANDAVTLINTIQKDQGPQPDLYVYVSDSALLDSASVTEVFDNLRLALDNRKGNSVVVLESNGRVSKKLSLVDNYARSQGAKVVYSRKAALEAIQQCLRGNHGK